ncbi:MAG: hypothetical protein ABIR70_04345 [Bryobacteraceae bacterium]
MKRSIFILAWGLYGLQAQPQQVKPAISQYGPSRQVKVIRLSPRFATAIRMAEAISSVVVGDPSKFLAEHSEKEPSLVLVKPVVEELAETNLLVTTVSGVQASFVLRSEGGSPPRAVDFLVVYSPSASFLVNESEQVSGVDVPVLRQLEGLTTAVPPSPAAVAVELGDLMEQLVEKQKHVPLPTLHGERAPSPSQNSGHIKAGVSEVVGVGREVWISFSVVNTSENSIELLPPQIQLAARETRGMIIRRSYWSANEQLPAKAYRLTPQHLEPGERANGVVVVDRPRFKQSNEALFLQIAESGAVDKPALAPFAFSASRPK